jgi:hypothetical protein
MTDLQILALAMPFALLGLVLLTAAFAIWQDKREDRRKMQR